MPVQDADMAGKIAEIKAILRSLLISKAGQNINLRQLNGMYRDVEEENIPFRNFGFPSLMDFLQNIPDTVRIIQKNGETCVQHVDTIKSAHVSSLVNRQRKPPAKKRTKASYSYRPTQRYFTPSLNRTAPHYFPNPTLSRNFAPNQHNPVPLQRNPIPPLCPTVPLLPTPAKVSALPSSSLLRQFLIDLKAQTTDCQQGIRKVDVLTRMNSLLSQAKPNNFGLYNIQLLNKHLQDINYMVSVKNDYICFRDDMIDNKENKKPVEQVVPKPNNSNDAYARTTRTDNYAASLDSDDVNEIHETFDSKGSFKHCQNTSESIYENPGASSCKNFNGHQKQDVEESVETQAVKRSDILSQRTKIRLQKLLENHPEGIWCSELPSMYKTDYAVDLEYYEMGFHNITEFVGAFPDIFLLVQPPSTNRQMVLDARKSNNSIKSQQKPTLAAYYNYDCLPNEPEPVPFELSADVRRRLIPENVMNLDETVCSIDVTTVYSESSEDYIEIYFSEIFTPSFFWIHLRKNRKKLASMMEEIHEFYNNQKIETYKVPQAILEVGLNVACTYNRAWHRAVVKKIKPDGFIIVWFYDYGTVKTYHPEELYFLHKRFSSLPAQAIACGLYNMKPINDTEWPNSSTNPFVNKVWGIPLIAIICTINEENNTMMINLTDTSDDQTDLHISDWMVESGYAEYGKMVNVPLHKLLHYDEVVLLKMRDEECRMNRMIRKAAKKRRNQESAKYSEEVAMILNHGEKSRTTSPGTSLLISDSNHYSASKVPVPEKKLLENTNLVKQTNTLTQDNILNMSLNEPKIDGSKSITADGSESKNGIELFVPESLNKDQNFNTVITNISEMKIDGAKSEFRNSSLNSKGNKEYPSTEDPESVLSCHPNEDFQSNSHTFSDESNSDPNRNWREETVDGSDSFGCNDGTPFLEFKVETKSSKQNRITIKYPTEFSNKYMNEQEVDKNQMHLECNFESDTRVKQEEPDEGYYTPKVSKSLINDNNLSPKVPASMSPSLSVYTVINLSENCDNKSVHIFHLNNEGWISAMEFVDAFTNLRDQRILFRLIDLLELTVNFLYLIRDAERQLFEQLDRSSLKVPREGNKIKSDFVFTLIPLRDTLQILTKLEFLDVETLKQAVPLVKEGKVNAKEICKRFENKILFDVLNLPRQYRLFKRSLRMTRH